MKILPKKNVYLDYAGATPVDEKVAKKMAFYKHDFFANPSAIYKSGVKVRNVIEDGRNKIAKLINAHSDEIIFTSSGTESDALAILGVIRNYESARPHDSSASLPSGSWQGADGLRIKNEKLGYKIPHIITTKIEHPAILENCKILEKRGEAEVTYISVDKNGIINVEELKDSLKENTVLVSVMYANNEIGTIQPIEEIAKIIRHFRKGKSAPQGLAQRTVLGGALLRTVLARPFPADFPLFHTDACQAMNYLYTENIEKLGVDLLSFNSSKIYGPKGIGVLYKKRKVELVPPYVGGGQEFGLHSGTESVALIAGFMEAFGIANKIKQKEFVRLTKIRDYGIEKLLSLSQTSGYKIILNGDKEKRLPNNINISIFGISSELLVIELDAKGIEVSSKSACKSSDNDDSYVIKAIRKICRKEDQEEGSLRITLGRYTKKEDIDKLISVLTKILDKYAGAIYRKM